MPLDTGQELSTNVVPEIPPFDTLKLPLSLSAIALENYFAEFPPPFDPPSALASIPLTAAGELEAVSFILSHSLPSLSSLPSTHSALISNRSISSCELSATAHTMLKTVKQITVCREKYWDLIRESVGQWKGAKLRAMARMDEPPAWWWLRERLVLLLVGNGINVEDGEMMAAVGQYSDGCSLKGLRDRTQDNGGASTLECVQDEQ